MVLFREHIFLDPATCGYRVWKYSQRCMVYLAKTALGQVCVYVAVWYTLSWIETALQLVWRDSTPHWILDVFKFQASTVSVWRAMGEGGSSTIKLACAVRTLISFFLTTNYHWRMRVPRLTRFALTTFSITIFTCKCYPLIQVMVSRKSTWFSKCFQHFLLCLKKCFYIYHFFSKWFLVFSKWFIVFITWFPEFGRSFLVFSKCFPEFGK